MRSEWETLTLAQAGIQLIDCDHRTPPAAPDGYPYVAIPQLKDGHIALNDVRRISGEHFAEWTKKLRPREHDVVVVRRCNSGTSAVVPKGLECAIGQNLVVLRADGRRVTPPFLRWLVRGEEWWEQVRKFLNAGAVFDSLKCRDIPNFEVLIPPLHEQHAICSRLNAIDERIGLLRQTNATLESIAQALFKSWFIDFDPVRAKAEGREPEGMDAATAALFPAEFEESALGLIPKGWTITSLAERCEVQIGGVWGEEARTAKASVEVCCLRGIDAVDLAKGDLPVPPVRWVTQKQIESRRLQEGDVLVEGSGSFCGRSLLWADSYKELVPHTATYSNFVKRLSAPAGPHYARWLQRHLDSVYQSGEVKNYRTGSAFPNLDLTGMLGVTRILPSEALLMQFDSFMRSIESQKVVRIRQAATLRNLRDALLPRLISGKLRLPEAQEQVEDAVA
jgi:type I restriction enzyme S subunit